MHRDCFIAHYQVVPGRRDWTYCPIHSQVCFSAHSVACFCG